MGDPVQYRDLALAVNPINVGRGPDWCYMDQDGGGMGIIIGPYGKDASSNAPWTVEGYKGLPGTCLVQWNNGMKDIYSVGFGLRFDLSHKIMTPEITARSREARQLLEERNAHNIMNSLFDQSQPKGAPPASKETISSLPTRTLSEQEANSLTDRGDACCICQDPYNGGDVVTTLPCEHMFHEEHIKTWLKEHNTCPVDRISLEPDKEIASPRSPEVFSTYEEVGSVAIVPREGPWDCPRCTYRNEEQTRCDACSTARNVWWFLQTHIRLWRSMAMLMHIFQDFRDSICDASKTDIIKSHSGRIKQRDQIINNHLPDLESAGWEIGKAVKLMFDGERDIISLIADLDTNSALVVQHIHSMLDKSSRSRLEDSLYRETANHSQQIQCERIISRWDPILYAIASVADRNCGPLSWSTVLNGILPAMEDCNWQLTYAVCLLRSSEKDIKKMSLGIDPASRIIADYLLKLATSGSPAPDMKSCIRCCLDGLLLPTMRKCTDPRQLVVALDATIDRIKAVINAKSSSEPRRIDLDNSDFLKISHIKACLMVAGFEEIHNSEGPTQSRHLLLRDLDEPRLNLVMQCVQQASSELHKDIAEGVPSDPRLRSLAPEMREDLRRRILSDLSSVWMRLGQAVAEPRIGESSFITLFASQFKHLEEIGIGTSGSLRNALTKMRNGERRMDILGEGLDSITESVVERILMYAIQYEEDAKISEGGSDDSPQTVLFSSAL